MSLGSSYGVTCRRRAGYSPEPCDKGTRDTGTWPSPVKEASSGESRHVECGNNDWKRKGVGGYDGEEEGVSIVCAEDEMEGRQGERVGSRLQVDT